jgi:hypothetical protein
LQPDSSQCELIGTLRERFRIEQVGRQADAHVLKVLGERRANSGRFEPAEVFSRGLVDAGSKVEEV